MGLFGALFAGVSGLDSQSNKISIISNNISNVNTIGYKESSAAFDTLVVPSGSSSFSPGGVISNNQQLVSKQGLVQGTSSGTDLSISGAGFFAVNTAAAAGVGQLLYTRSGSFTQDSAGNFVNSNGLFLQGWLLDSSGNKVNSTNSSDPSSLQTVTIASNSSGAATATSTVALTANLNASQPVLLGSGETVNFDKNSANNLGNTATDLLASNEYDADVPNSGMVRGDSFTVTTTANNQTPVATAFTYGGFSIGKNITEATAAGNGDNTTYINQVNPVTTTGSGHVVTLAAPNNNYFVGQSVTITGASAVGGFTAPQINGTYTITAVTGGANGTIQYTSAGTSTSAVAGGGGTGIGIALAAPAVKTFDLPSGSFTDTAAIAGGTSTITVTTPSAHGYGTGQTVNIENAAGFDGIPASLLNGPHSNINVIDSTHFSFTITTTAIAAGGVTGGGTTASVANRTYPFAGNILDATTTADAFLATTTTAPFSASALDFQISGTSSSTSTFTYVAGSPDTSSGQFNSLDTLVQAINATTSYNARIVNNRLYVGATDANEGVTFTNGDASGTNGKLGIDWVSELGLSNVPAASTISSNTKRFDDLSNLETQINSTAGLTASITDPTGAASISINASNPENTIEFADSDNAIATAANGNTAVINTGSVIQELGFTSSTGAIFTSADKGVGTATANGYDTGQFGVKYASNISSKNMASGAIKPQFTSDVVVYDALGVSHTLAMDFVKIDSTTNTWAVEVNAVPASDVTVTAGTPAGQLAAGTVSFNGDGSLANVSAGLAGKVTIDWSPSTSAAGASTITFNFGSQNKTDGLSQFSATSNTTNTVQNGSSSGELTGVSIDQNGFVIESFSNGQSQKAFQIPLISINNPNGLEGVSGDAFKITQAAGTATAVNAGTNGTGSLTSSSLEESTVDLSTQLTDLIVAQQAYGANSKLLTVADQLLQSLDQIIQ